MPQSTRMGTLTLALTSGKLKQKKLPDQTWHNYAIGFVPPVAARILSTIWCPSH